MAFRSCPQCDVSASVRTRKSRVEIHLQKRRFKCIFPWLFYPFFVIFFAHKFMLFLPKKAPQNHPKSSTPEGVPMTPVLVQKIPTVFGCKVVKNINL
jgi:hypothetical protein